MGERSGFNVCVPNISSGFGVCSWNARALAHHDMSIRKRKLRELAILLARFDAVIVLEAHGLDDLYQQVLKLHFRTHQYFSSFCLDPQGIPRSDAGGVLIFVKHEHNVMGPPIVHEPGRILEISIGFGSFLLRLLSPREG